MAHSQMVQKDSPSMTGCNNLRIDPAMSNFIRLITQAQKQRTEYDVSVLSTYNLHTYDTTHGCLNINNLHTSLLRTQTPLSWFFKLYIYNTLFGILSLFPIN